MAKTRNVFITALRIAAAALCFSAVFITAISRETVTVFGISMEARFQYTPPFKFLVGANSVVSIYSIAVLFVPQTSSLNRLIITVDLLVALVLTASISAAGSVSYIGKKGNMHAGWVAVCDKVPDYCNKMAAALACNFGAASLYLLLVLYTIHAIFNAMVAL